MVSLNDAAAGSAVADSPANTSDSAKFLLRFNTIDLPVKYPLRIV